MKDASLKVAMTPTLTYYETHALEFVDRSVGAGMGDLYERFLAAIPEGGSILDAGCGSGRDAKMFKSLGYQVDAFDGSAEVARLASAYCGFEVHHRLFDDVSATGAYDGVWACASLLHVPLAELEAVTRKLWRAVRVGGCMYASFKYGCNEREAGGRHFTDLDVSSGSDIFWGLGDIYSVESWLSDDTLGRGERWINFLIRRTAVQPDATAAVD